jgi:hypothetical protein
MGVRFGDGSAAEENLSVAEPRRGRPIQWTRRRRWRPWWSWASAAVILAGVLHLSADPAFDRFFRMDVSPLSSSLSMIQQRPESKSPGEPREEPEPPRAPRATPPRVGGLRSVISGGSSRINSVLRTALDDSGKTLSGWTVTLELDPPMVTPREDFGTSMVSCRLTGEVSATGPGAPVELGPMSRIISQTDEYNACNAAARSLAKDVVSKLIQQLGTKGET